MKKLTRRQLRKMLEESSDWRMPRQDSTQAQLRDLIHLGNEHGLYDAVNLVERLLDS